MQRTTALAALLLLGCGAGSTGPKPDAPGLDAPAGGPRPPPSAGHDLVYADDLGAVILVNAGLGGMTSPPSSTPTTLWSWDGARWSVLDAAGPPIRNLGGVAWDAGRHVLVLHGGGYSVDLSYGDTWEWDRGRGWRRLDVAGPGVRDHTQMSYDAARERVVLFGGQRDLTTFPADTWLWDGAQWTSDEGAAPPPRVHHAMAYDAAAQRVVIFGGYDGAQDRGDTWSWDGAVWAAQPPDQPARTHARMAFDEELGGLVLVGGVGGEGPMLRGAQGWQALGAVGGPSPRYLAGVAYDRRRNVLVVFGGGDPAGSALYDDTWELAGGTWTKVF